MKGWELKFANYLFIYVCMYVCMCMHVDIHVHNISPLYTLVTHVCMWYNQLMTMCVSRILIVYCSLVATSLLVSLVYTIGMTDLIQSPLTVMSAARPYMAWPGMDYLVKVLHMCVYVCRYTHVCIMLARNFEESMSIFTSSIYTLWEPNSTI